MRGGHRSGAIPGRAKRMNHVTFLTGRGGLPKINITTPWSTAEVYLHGAHLTHFQKLDEPPLLFLSEQSRFEPNVPIRGGIPIIFPWFGKPAHMPGQHGFARNRSWTLKEITTPDTGIVTLRLALPPGPEFGNDDIAVEYAVTIGDNLGAELVVTNKSAQTFAFENCLHTYFAVGNIHSLQIVGLKGADYLDSLDGHQRKTETSDAIRFAGEVDRTYLNTRHRVEIRDAALKRIIYVEKAGSNSTVVWNPWIAKGKAMPDFGDEEYSRMVCVESGNVAENQITLAPSESTALKVQFGSKASA
jgi:glucose-6-phosphate 1-epimerase